MTTALQATLDLLDLEVIERNLFRGHSPRSEWQRVFGGQVIGQALSAAARTVEGRICHSLHAYFLRPGDPNIPIVYEVDPIRDGRSFTTRRVRAIQHGRSIFSMEVSFQVAEEGVQHQLPMPQVTPPEELPSLRERLDSQRAGASSGFTFYFETNRAFEDRTVDPVDPFRPEVKPPYQHTWMKPNGMLPDDLTMRRGSNPSARDWHREELTSSCLHLRSRLES
jgi:acyl-CoA thioesterase II